MLNRFINVAVPLLFVLSILLGCKEELVVEQKKENNNITQRTLAKSNDSLSVQQDSLSQKEKKNKIAKLKKEHEKPYVVIEKPEKLLLEKLKARTNNKSLSKTDSFNSLQSSQSCYTMEVDVWALVKYHPISGFIVGISPKGSFNYPDNKYWQYDRNTLITLKYTYGFSKINMEPMAIIENNNAVYTANEILVGITLDYDAVVNQFSSYNLGTLWGSYIDEARRQGANSSDVRQKLYEIRSWWKNKFGNNSLFIVGETTEELTHEFDDIADYVNSTIYADYQYLLPYSTCGRCYIETEDDQRDVWTDFNNSFGGKFNHVWISGELDRGEMDLLIGHAKNMGKNSIWLYAGELGMSDQSYWDAIGEFNYYAFVHGYLRREEKKYIYVFNYIGNDDPCYDYQITSWDLIDIIDTGETRIR